MSWAAADRRLVAAGPRDRQGRFGGVDGLVSGSRELARPTHPTPSQSGRPSERWGRAFRWWVALEDGTYPVEEVVVVVLLVEMSVGRDRDRFSR